MPQIKDLTLVTIDNLHVIIPEFIQKKKIIISSYEDMMETVLQMIKGRHIFNMEKDILRSLMEDLTYMYCPGDDLNKDRVFVQLCPSEEEDEDEEEDEEEDEDRESMEIPNIKVDSLLEVSDVE